jgi:hypothetical protein
MGSTAEVEDDDVGGSTVDRELSTVLSDLDQLRLKLERLREAAEKRSSEVRIRVPPAK